MTKFVTPTRYDQALADQGISIAVDENGTYYGTFDVKCYDPYSPFFKVAKERYNRNQKAEIKLLKDEQEKAIHQFVHIAMTGWKDIKSEDGDVPFTKEDAFQFLTQTDIGLFVFGELFAQATDTKNFKAVDDEDGEVDPVVDAQSTKKN